MNDPAPLPPRSRLSKALLWDAFMVWVALVNLGLILFDLTFLWLRPTYVAWLPVVPRLYDRVKGIRPHPLTEAILGEVEGVRRRVEASPAEPVPEERLETLRALFARLLVENPFERAGESASFEAIRRQVAVEVEQPTFGLDDPARAAAVATAYWPAERGLLRHRLDQFERSIRPRLEANFFREFDRDGQLEDHFWKLDLPFLLLFVVEFGWRWIGSVRRREYARWWFFPVFRFYDVMGLLPTAYLRPFRVLRAVSIYMRLRRSELSSVGRDVLSRAMGTFGAIVAEEVSDRVAILILDELASEIGAGTHRRIVAAVVGERRAAIEAMLRSQARALASDPELLAGVRRLVELNLEQAVERSVALDAVPLPQMVVRPLARSIGAVVVEATFESVGETLRSAEGGAAIDRLVAAALDRAFAAESVDTLEPLAREISLELIAHMRATVAVRKWARPAEEATPSPPA